VTAETPAAAGCVCVLACVHGSDGGDGGTHTHTHTHTHTLAQDMLSSTTTVRFSNGKPLHLRIGVHIGPAYAGRQLPGSFKADSRQLPGSFKAASRQLLGTL
jgi:hypothetical protein